MSLSNDRMMIVLSSPSGVGKTTLAKKIASLKKYEVSISYTTRKPRTNEKDGKDYYFISKDEFKNLIENNELIFKAKKDWENMPKNCRKAYTGVHRWFRA